MLRGAQGGGRAEPGGPGASVLQHPSAVMGGVGAGSDSGEWGTELHEGRVWLHLACQHMDRRGCF